ncbi:hypothetical protein CEXT_571221 [Caerostris extrusa]|uniref:Uncharacterized protein n=1 Tax=Caerostris extrusa TaxID=172846 RepID=A0AAV4NEZ5_CAEEX|nr:hypothetical protein CEXT_571221 [Caerostris extrusa]
MKESRLQIPFFSGFYISLPSLEASLSNLHPFVQGSTRHLILWSLRFLCAASTGWRELLITCNPQINLSMFRGHSDPRVDLQWALFLPPTMGRVTMGRYRSLNDHPNQNKQSKRLSCQDWHSSTWEECHNHFL